MPGGKRMVIERLDSEVCDQLWPLIADAGLDWLVRLEDGLSDQTCDCRILAGSAAGQGPLRPGPWKELPAWNPPDHWVWPMILTPVPAMIGRLAIG